jgi:hypothetical protein
MNLLKYFGCIVVITVSFVFAGCEKDDNEAAPVITNETTYVENNTTVVVPPATSPPTDGGQGTGPAEPPAVEYPEVIISNISSFSVPITFSSTVDNSSKSLEVGKDVTFHYSGSYVFTHSTLAGETVTYSKSDGKNYVWTIYDSESVTNTVEAYYTSF